MFLTFWESNQLHLTRTINVRCHDIHFQILTVLMHVKGTGHHVPDKDVLIVRASFQVGFRVTGEILHVGEDIELSAEEQQDGLKVRASCQQKVTDSISPAAR